MAEDAERQRKIADDIMGAACLPQALIANGVHKAMRDAIVEALAREHTEGWKRQWAICLLCHVRVAAGSE